MKRVSTLIVILAAAVSLCGCGSGSGSSSSGSGSSGNSNPGSGTTASTTTTLAASATTISVGTTVTFTATVAPAAGTGTPTGGVTFNDGGITIGTAQLTSGKATFSTSSLAAGSHSITAVYDGSTNFSGSTSLPVNVVVTVVQSSQFCATLNEQGFSGGVTQQTCALGTTSYGVPENQNDFWGAIQGGVCTTTGWPPADLNGFSCTWPVAFTVSFNEPVQSVALVSTVQGNNGPSLTMCTQSGVGNILATFTNNQNSTGTVTITQVTSSFSNTTVPADCSAVAFDVNGEAIVIAVGLQLSGGGPN